MRKKTIGDAALIEVDANGPPLGDDRSAGDLVAEALSQGVSMVVAPAARLHPDFFRLSTGLAGAFLQKFVNYRIRFVVVGDLSAACAHSKPLADFVRESNRGKSVWFVRDEAELETQLTRQS